VPRATHVAAGRGGLDYCPSFWGFLKKKKKFGVRNRPVRLVQTNHIRLNKTKRIRKCEPLDLR
jgi:hypothetical protein